MSLAHGLTPGFFLMGYVRFIVTLSLFSIFTCIDVRTIVCHMSTEVLTYLLTSFLFQQVVCK